ncbi:unnamed protein product [Phytophthora fragariaefolia]|uniref:Unnamed protein product n=1 Tax=Phytophthora fragariaefolia TaxID=1490495 RepID=A0A9W6TU98_9STRA|nr:unnamed protein product [Phytophthora fragariaefolia]
MKKEECHLALDVAEQYRTGKLKTPAKLEDVARLLDGPYSLFHAKPMAETLMLPYVNVQVPAQIQLYSAGQSVPVVKAIPQLEQVTEALCAMELCPKNLKMVAPWPGYGCVTRNQLEDMRLVHEAYQTFTLANKTVPWMETVEWDARDMCAPFDDTRAVAKKLSVAKGLGAANPKYDRVIGIFNGGAHWIAFVIEKNANICDMFDPLQSERNYSAIERRVRKVMETVLGLEGKLDYKQIDWCKQQDGSSCGIWCIAVLEMLLAGASWNDKIYKLQPYLRMRHLYKVISLLMKPVCGE